MTGGGEAPSPVTLVQMPNGTGKTTTLGLLRGVLSGEIERWSKEQLAEYRKRGEPAERGEFQVRLLFGTQRITLRAVCYYEEGRVDFATTLPSGMREGFTPPKELARYLRASFVNFFIFDGELADRLLRSSDGSAESVVEELFQLRDLKTMADRVQTYWERKAEGKPKEDKGYSRRKNKVAELRERIQLLTAERERLRGQYDSLRITWETRSTQFEAALAAQSEERAKLLDADRAVSASNELVRAVTQEVLSAFRDPHAIAEEFAREMLQLKLSFDRVKLPESAGKEFFDELAAEDVCVCGRELDEGTRATIRSRAKEYLGSEDVAFLNAVKSEVSEKIGPNPEAAEAALNGAFDRLERAIRAAANAQTQLDALREDIVESRPELKDVRGELRQLETEMAELERRLERYEDKSDTAGHQETYGIEVLQRRLDNAEEQLAEASQTLELKKKRDVLLSIMRDAHASARSKLCDELRDEANDRIAKLMPYNAVRIANIKRSLELSGASGQGQGGASVGETLSVAYAFLSTLFNRAEHILPFVVDSPANPIDLQVRRQVAELIPRLTEQFIAFTISSEREAFLEPLQRAAPRVQLLTLFRKGPTGWEVLARANKDTAETTDGFVVPGEKFFKNFHVNEENQAR